MDQNLIEKLLKITEDALWWADEGANDKNLVIKKLREEYNKLKIQIKGKQDERIF
jgi:hypothetical protein